MKPTPMNQEIVHLFVFNTLADSEGHELSG
jgi:hypothetical protein